MKYYNDIESVKPDYTGGNIYCFEGWYGKYYFLACSDFYDVRMFTTQPQDENDIYDSAWQDEHLAFDMTDPENLDFFHDMCEWIVNNEPDGNYSKYDIEDLISDIIEIRKNERKEDDGCAPYDTAEEYVIATYEDTVKECTYHAMVTLIKSFTGNVYVVQTWEHYPNGNSINHDRRAFTNINDTMIFYESYQAYHAMYRGV